MIPLPSGALGIDCSHWNTIDWAQVRGVDFAMIAGGDGTTFIDPEVQNNIRGAESQHLPWGLYWVVRAEGTTPTDYAHAGQTAAARLLLEARQAGGYHGGLLPPVADIEEALPTPEAMVEAVNQFCNSLDAAIRNPAQRTMIYADLSTLEALAHASNVNLIADRDVWLAWYNPGLPARVPPFKAPVLQQFTNHKALSGDTLPVDWDKVLVGNLPAVNNNQLKVNQAVALLQSLKW